MRWANQKFIDVMQDWLDQYWTTKGQERLDVVKTTATIISTVAKENKLHVPPGLEQVCALISY
jgi:hypothetical protein